jgi:hypothetical protein
LAIQFAQAVIAERSPNRPFVSLDDFLRRMWPDTNRSRWFGVMLGGAATPQDLGDASMRYYGVGQDYRDYEERDWLFGRMANLLTVRSDTFTAYVVIRVVGANNETSERRFMAIFDRSNVFLPPKQARPSVITGYVNGFPTNGSGAWGEQFTDANGNLLYDPGETFTDLNGNGFFDLWDDSGEMWRYDPAGTIWGPVVPPVHVPDPDFFDRKYVTPKVVAVQTVTE